MYFLKKHLTCYANGDNEIIICDNRIDFSITKTNRNILILNNLINKGVENINDNEIVAGLFEKNFLNQYELETNRNLLFLNYSTNKVLDSKVLNKKIFVLGAGGVGANVIYLLAQFGFTNLTLVDFDYVSDSDIFKHFLFKKEDIGKKKGIVIKNLIIEKFEIEINYIDKEFLSKNDVKTVVAQYDIDFLVLGIDPKPIIKILINDLCFKLKIPFIMGFYSYENIVVGPILVPGITSCLNYLNSLIEEKKSVSENYFNTEKLYLDYFIHPSATFISQTLSSLIFKEILFYLSEDFEKCQLIGRSLIYDLLKFNSTYHYFKCKNCKVCSISDV